MAIDNSIFICNLCRNMFTDACKNGIFLLCGFILPVFVVLLWLTNTPITLLPWCISSWQGMFCFSVQDFNSGSQARQEKLILSFSITSVSWTLTLKWKFFEVWGYALCIFNLIPFMVLYSCRLSFLCSIVSLEVSLVLVPRSLVKLQQL